MQPIVSFVISTHNRREVLRSTLRRVQECGLAPDQFEVLVVDNASSDSTAVAVAREFPTVHVMALDRNMGPCSKNLAIEEAKGEYIVFLDDDSYPLPGSIERMISHFRNNETLGAAIFTVTLPDGSHECCAYPDVFIGCGTGFRRQALAEVGGLPTDFFMAAEEYDLSLRLLDAGWDIRSFNDLHVIHMKTPASRSPWRLMRLDTRNNFLIATRYFPPECTSIFTWDWMVRYYRIAAKRNQRTAFVAGLGQGMMRMFRKGHRKPVSDDTFDRFARVTQIQEELQAATDQLGLKSVLFIDYGKNILPYWDAAMNLKLEIVGIADRRLRGCGKYRGIPVIGDAEAVRLQFDAAIITTSSPVHAAERAAQWRRFDQRPVLDILTTYSRNSGEDEDQMRRGLAA
ncbi:MAG TPA: glycosyltransferase [Tepidisphaeraceae bacterium]|nr:glycosyltransferase [Tepidisphaeraceae bacterium]